MAQNVKIYGWTECPFQTDAEGVFSRTARKVWFSPDNTKAVLEIWAAELCVAVKVKECGKKYLECEYVDHYIVYDFDTSFKTFIGVDWNFLKYGFCKLMSRSLSTWEVYVKRFYYEKRK